MLTVQSSEELKETAGHEGELGQPRLRDNRLDRFRRHAPEEDARLPVQYALGGENSGRFVDPDGATP